MALTSASTFAQIEAEYLDTAGYLISESASLAKRHAVAIRYMLLRIPATSIKGSNTVSYNVNVLQRELEKAEEYAKARDATRTIRRADFRQMRSNG